MVYISISGSYIKLKQNKMLINKLDRPVGMEQWKDNKILKSAPGI